MGAVRCLWSDKRLGVTQPHCISHCFIALRSVEAGRHYLVLDTNIILNQIDLLESPGLNNVVILSTVLEEVKLQLNKIALSKSLIPTVICRYATAPPQCTSG